MAKGAKPVAKEPAIIPRDDPRSRIVLVSLLELAQAERAATVAIVAAALAPGETPLFVTDDPDFRPFAARRHLYEYLPPRREQSRFAGPREWETYLAARLKALLRKWAPVRVVTVGTSLPDFILKAGADQ